MARIRTFKPTFFQSEDVSALPFRARLTWLGLWAQCDDQGRFKDNVKLVKAGVWPLDDVSLRDVEEDLTTLADHGRIVRYEVDGGKYLAIVNWHHQRIDKPTKSVLPPPPPDVLPNTSQNTPGGLPEDSREEGKGGEGKGGESRARASTRPDPWCTKHPGGTDTPCRPCATARTRSETWTPPTPTVDDALTVQTCHHGGVVGRCPSCRREAQGAAS